MNKQEMFDKVWDWFVVQKNPSSLDDFGYCSYRGKGGTKCAIGVLIPDEMYVPSMEGPINLLIEIFPPICEILGFTLSDNLFLYQLQQCHDRAAYTARLTKRMVKSVDPNVFTIDVKRELSILAGYFDLSIPESKAA